MVSIYSLTPVYTFLYTTTSDNVLASFVQKRKVLRFVVQKNYCLHTYAIYNFHFSNCTQPYAFGLTPPLPLLCVRTMLMTPKDIAFLSFAKNMDKNIWKNISRNLSSKYTQKLLDHTKKSATDLQKKYRKLLMILD